MWRMMMALCALVASAGASLAGDVSTASSTWDELRPAVFGERALAPSAGEVTIYAPYRAADDRSVPITIHAALPDGAAIKTLSVIIDENPMPVSAVFHMQAPRDRFETTLSMRFNGPSAVHAVVEAQDGRLFVTEAFVKTSGLGACSAPPVTDLVVSAQGLGRMTLADVSAAPSEGAPADSRRARLRIAHPNLTGLQMNQVTLLYIPARYVSEVEVAIGEAPLFRMESGISLAENPEIEFDYRRGDADTVSVRAIDTDDAVFEQEFPIDGA